MVRAHRAGRLTEDPPIDARTFKQELTRLLPDFLARQRWGAPDGAAAVRVARVETLSNAVPTVLWVVVEVDDAAGSVTRLHVPLGARPAEPEGVDPASRLGVVATDREPIHLYDALAEEAATLELVHHVFPDQRHRAAATATEGPTGTSVVLDDRQVLTVRRIVDGATDLDVATTESLGRHGFAAVAVPVGVWRVDGVDRAVLRREERAVGDGRTVAAASLAEVLDRRRPPRELRGDLAADARSLGSTVARLHVALAETFGFSPADGDAWADDMVGQLREVVADRLDPGRVGAVFDRLRAARDLGMAVRVHGDLHLGQVQRLKKGWMVEHFGGGGPGAVRSEEERRRPSSPLRDVAGMTRSFQAVATEALRSCDEVDDEARVLARAWAERNMNAFLAGYASVDEVHPLLPRDRQSRDALLSVFELDQAVRDVAVELSRLDGAADVSVAAVARLVDADPPLPDFPDGPPGEPDGVDGPAER